MGDMLCVDGFLKYSMILDNRALWCCRSRSPEVNIQDTHGGPDRQRDQYHSEEEVFAEQRHGKRCGRNNFGQQQEEHSQRHKDGNAERDLFARVRGQVEDQDGEECQCDARNYQINRIEQGLAAHRQLEGDVGEGLGAARIVFLITAGGHFEDIPFHLEGGEENAIQILVN